MVDGAMQARLPVLTYHSIDETGSPVSTSPALFEHQMRTLAAAGWQSLSLDAVSAGVGPGVWPRRSFLLTFDDGYHNVIEHAAPVLARHGFSATVFVISSRVGSTTKWSGQPAWVPDAPLLDWPELRELASAGWNLGGHSRTHPRLTTMPSDAAEREMLECRRDIEDRCAVPVHAFAYPYGASSPAVERLVERHYRMAFGTRLAFVTARSRLTCLDRVDAYYLRRLRLDQLGAPSTRLYLAARRGIRRIAGH
jgi:peptidoglycan/xylan/chitin deacetylase (PgdA/CDA1 family)